MKGPVSIIRTQRRRVIALAFVLWALAILGVFARISFQPTKNSVYEIYAKAAHNWLSGNSLYDWQEAAGYRYAPVVAILFVPLAVLPNPVAEVVWRLLDVAVLLGGFAWCTSLRIPTRDARRYWAIALILLLPLALGSVNSGQATCMLAGLLLCTIAAVYRERWNVAAAAASIAFFLKLYPLSLALLLGLLFGRKFIVRFLIACAIGLLLPFLFRRPSAVLQQYGDWILRLGSENRQDRPAIRWFHDVRLLLRTFGVIVNGGTFMTMQVLAGIMTAVVCWYGHMKRWPLSVLLGRTLALATCWMTLFGPSTEISTYTLIAPSLVWALTSAWFDRSARAARIAPIISYGMFIAVDVALWFPFGRPFAAVGIAPVAGLVFLTVILIDCCRDLWVVSAAPSVVAAR
jgi:hypothetical protein